MKHTLRLICSLGLIPFFGNFAMADQKHDAKKIDQARQELNYGYAYLYKNLKSVAWTDELMVVKKEAQEVNEIGKDIGQTCGKWADKLQSLTKDYPNLKLDDTGQPEAVEGKKKALKKEKISAFMPITGKSGIEFERMLLISTNGAIDDLRIHTAVLRDMETNSGLKETLSGLHSDLERLNDRIDRLLNKRYFKYDIYKK